MFCGEDTEVRTVVSRLGCSRDTRAEHGAVNGTGRQMVTDHSYALVALNFKVAISDFVSSSTISGVPG